MQCVGTYIWIVMLLVTWKMVLGSRPALIADDDQFTEYLLSNSDMEKSHSRWRALLLTDDEDIMVADGSGMGMQRDGSSTQDNVYTPQIFIESHFKDSCCKLGKIAAKSHHSCYPGFYVQKLTLMKLRQRVRSHMDDDVSPSSWTLQDTLSREYRRCALRQNTEFKKCCSASHSKKNKYGLIRSKFGNRYITQRYRHRKHGKWRGESRKRRKT